MTDGLADAIEDFVEKKNLESIGEFIKKDLKQMQNGMRGEKEIIGKGGGLSAEEIEREVKRRHDEQRDKEGLGKKHRGRAKKEGGEGGEEKDVLEGLDVGQLSLLGISRDADGDEDDGYGDDEQKEEKKGGRGRERSSRGRGGAGTRGRGRGRGAKAAPASRRKSKVEEEQSDDMQDWDDEEEGRGRGRGRG